LYGAIFFAILAIAPFLVLDKINSIPRGIGFLVGALAFAAVLYGIVELWRETPTRWYVVSVVIFFVIVNLLVWLISPRQLDVARLEDELSQLKRVNADLQQKVQKNAAADRLLAFVGKDIARACKVYVNNTFFVGESAAMDCTPAQPPELIRFHLAYFENLDQLNDDFSTAVGVAKNARKDNIENCKAKKSIDGEWRLRNDAAQPVAGRLLCFIDDENDSWIQWSYNNHKIYASAIYKGDNLGALYDWWSRSWSIKA
jgi:type II secretory pathway component PulJ